MTFAYVFLFPSLCFTLSTQSGRTFPHRCCGTYQPLPLSNPHSFSVGGAVLPPPPPSSDSLSMMASYSPTHNGWFGERGVHQGVGLDILFSGRDFDTPDLYSPNDTRQPQEAKSHYACPRAPQRSLYGWGTYSPPPQRSSTESRGGASSSARPVSLNQCQGYHAHTLPLPRRALAVFRPR